MPEKVMVKIGKKRIDLVKEILSVLEDSVTSYVDPKTLFEYTPDSDHLANAATIKSIIDKLVAAEISLGAEFHSNKVYCQIAKAINAIIRLGSAQLIIARSKLSGLPFLAIKIED